MATVLNGALNAVLAARPDPARALAVLAEELRRSPVVEPKPAPPVAKPASVSSVEDLFAMQRLQQGVQSAMGSITAVREQPPLTTPPAPVPPFPLPAPPPPPRTTTSPAAAPVARLLRGCARAAPQVAPRDCGAALMQLMERQQGAAARGLVRLMLEVSLVSPAPSPSPGPRLALALPLTFVRCGAGWGCCG